MGEKLEFHTEETLLDFKRGRFSHVAFVDRAFLTPKTSQACEICDVQSSEAIALEEIIIYICIAVLDL